MGVSILSFRCWLPIGGGAGRANGLGGPWAPALKRALALALGEGGGRTTPVPEEWLASVLVAFAGVLSDGRGEDSLASASERSSGICTLSWGRLAPL